MFTPANCTEEYTLTLHLVCLWGGDVFMEEDTFDQDP